MLQIFKVNITAKGSFIEHPISILVCASPVVILDINFISGDKVDISNVSIFFGSMRIGITVSDTSSCWYIIDPKSDFSGSIVPISSISPSIAVGETITVIKIYSMCLPDFPACIGCTFSLIKSPGICL